MRTYRVTETENSEEIFSAVMTQKEIRRRYNWLDMSFWTMLGKIELHPDCKTTITIERITD